MMHNANFLPSLVIACVFFFFIILFYVFPGSPPIGMYHGCMYYDIISPYPFPFLVFKFYFLGGFVLLESSATHPHP
ncbi:hypothetical protein BDV36DRAFT_245856 [Aspergillus pseudocaelatus]|uniref:Uncharacterized protein n=1 Tax=Aspergillus pseudocaelatus TaxID=1825620 RepID=A0ABQ6WYD8_9EURO|nr:hypothetical protein BDV36DRAFT_245856 [Aspergillus pseudocaelatus]